MCRGFVVLTTAAFSAGERARQGAAINAGPVLAGKGRDHLDHERTLRVCQVSSGRLRS